MPNETKDTIVLIHGLWMTPLSWENWIARYTELGYDVLAPAWPGVDRDIEAIRADPSSLADLDIAKIVAHYDAIIHALEKPPIIMGHSFGGLMTQILLDRGLGSAGVAIGTAPVKGILILPFSSIRVAWPAISNPFNYDKAEALTEEQFRYAFGNLLSEEASKAAYDRYAIPGPDQLLFQASLANFNPNSPAAVDFHNDDRAPLLLIAGGKDHISPPQIAHANCHLYQRSKAVTDLKEYPEHSHYILGEENWEEAADYALQWATQHAQTK